MLRAADGASAQRTESMGTMSDTTPNAAAETDRAAIWTFGLGAAFLVLGTFILFGFFTRLGFPFVLGSWGPASPGRLWPMALMAISVGGVSLLHVGALSFLLPRLTGVSVGGRLERLGPAVAGGLVGAAIVATAFGVRFVFLGGVPLAADLLLVVALLGPAVLAIRTVLAKREATIYPTLWYLVGGLVAAVVGLAVANFPLTEATGSLIQSNVGRGMFRWGWVVAGGVGSAFYLVPRITGRPLFSRPLAIMGFFSLLLPGMFVGLSTHLFGPIPDWAEAVGVGMRFAFVVPAFLIPAGLLLSGEGALGRLADSPQLRLVAAGTSLVSLGALVWALTAFPSIQSFVGLTVFDLGTTVVVLSGAVLLATAMALHAFPRLIGRALVDDTAADWHMRLTVTGALTTAALLWIAGVNAGVTARAGAETGAWVNAGEGFVEVLESVRWAYQVLPLTSLAILAGQVVFARIIWSTWTTGDVVPREAVVAADEPEPVDSSAEVDA